ncbi:MAG: hypothetical protein JWR77_1751 [Rhizorhabdus sp.]|nr:hypothetical protein [Rhizorhabdus sp.]
MFMMFRRSILSCALFALAGTAQAAEPGRSHFRLALSLGSLGIGPEVTYRPYRWLALRGSATFLSANPHAHIDDIQYKSRLKLRNYGLMGDIYPFGNGWRLSAGFREDDNRMLLQATPMMPITIGGSSYTPAQVGTLSGEVSTRQYAPVVTIGYGGTVAKGFSIGGDIGVMFHGRPRMGTLTSSSTLVTPADLMTEQGEIQRDIRKYRYYPVLQMSAGYRF